MSQNPQDSNSYDYNPEYGNLNEQNAQNGQQQYQQQYQQPGQYGQPMMVPVGIVQKTPEQLAGEKAAQTSLVLGIIGLVCNFIVSWWSFGLPSLILGVIGIFKANEAERYGAAASAGRIMSWINAVIGGLYLLFLGGGLLMLVIAGAASSSSSSHFAELVSTLALF
ncbi:DUF4190 domain-containing protein [Rothia mucilaginosa]|uniref:DUF4190 domain-containing protein n=1 Tax=Rothia mucilaginosa TaxID=43675 RepID=UPI0025CB8BBC|nr:DUF4190 domain-containing protein [Rothia mucilaginosa]